MKGDTMTEDAGRPRSVAVDPAHDDLPSATLHEAAGRVGALPARIKPAFAGAQIFGPAFPVSAPTGDNLWIHHAVATANPGDVLVVATGFDASDEDQYGYWGEILSEAAKARGLGGLVIDGGVRDVDQLADVGFPVFSAAISIRGTVKDPTAGGSIGESVRIGAVTVSRGDLVKADADGVVVIEASTAAAVANASRKREDDEARIVEQLRSGRTTLELYSLPAIPGGGARSMTDQAVERLGALDTCAVSDALDALGVPGAVSQLPPQSVPRRIAGRCVTVQLVESSEAPQRHLGTAAVAAAGPGDVIVVAADGRLASGGWGGVLSAGAAYRGVQGVVLDGAARDIDEAVELGFPVYARSATTRTARGRVVEGDWNVGVAIGGVAVTPGDYVIADRSGVVFVPHARIDEVLDKAEFIQARETAMVARIREGEAMPDVMGHDYETLLKGPAQ